MKKFEACKITDIKQNAWGEMRATLVYPDGKQEELEGTYALGYALSWSRATGEVSSNGFVCREYVQICGAWQ